MLRIFLTTSTDKVLTSSIPVFRAVYKAFTGQEKADVPSEFYEILK